MNRQYKVIIGVSVLALLTVSIVVYFLFRKTPPPNPKPKPKPASDKYTCNSNGQCVIDNNSGSLTQEDCKKKCKPVFQEVKGLSGSGYCKTGKQMNAAYFLWDSTQNPPPTQDSCQKACQNWSDDACMGYDWDNTSKSCQMYLKAGAGGEGASAGYKSSYDKYFPDYASPWLCNLPLADLTTSSGKFCMTAFGSNKGSVAADPPCALSTNDVKCFKHNTTEHFEDFKVKVGVMDSSKIQIVLSDPFIYSAYLDTTYHTFYYWFLNMIRNAEKSITLINVYWVLGKWQSDSPKDYQSAIYGAMVDALNRGVTITVVTSSVAAATEVACDEFMEQQFQVNPFLNDTSRKLFKHLKVNYFFHDKIYISDKEGYIGGQNLSGPASIDFGVTIFSQSPLYNDLVERTEYFVKGASGGTPPVMTFKYTYDNPYSDPTSKTEYFLGLSPFSPTCGQQEGSGVRSNFTPVFPQENMSLSTMYPEPVGGYGDTSAGTVSYEWWHLYDLIRYAKKFIKITNFDFSFFGSSLSKAGYDIDIATALDNAIKRGVTVEMWIHNSPMADSMPNNPSSTCGMVTCTHTSQLLESWSKTKNFTINYWYSTPYNKSFPQCKILHAKIYYSDYGLLISSSNFVPDYWCHTPDTALCVRYDPEKGATIPDWVSTGVENCFSLLKSNIKIKDYDKDYLCGHPTPNIDQKGAPCGKDGSSYLCSSTCASCSATKNANVVTSGPNSVCNMCYKN